MRRISADGAKFPCLPTDIQGHWFTMQAERANYLDDDASSFNYDVVTEPLSDITVNQRGLTLGPYGTDVMSK